MFEQYRFRRWLRRVQADRRRVVAMHRKEIIDARSKNQSPDDIERIEANERMECELIDDEIAERQTRFLLDQARKHLLPVPAILFGGNADRSEDWVKSCVTRKCHLTNSASLNLKSLIAEAEDRDWRRVARLIPLLSAITGLLGVVVAIIALITRPA